MDSLATLRVYKELAEWYERQGQPAMRDRFLILAAEAAFSSGKPDEAERLRQRLLQGNPHHMLKPFSSFAQALQSSNVQIYIHDLQTNYPPETALGLLKNQPGVAEQTVSIPTTAPLIEIHDEPTLPLDNTVESLKVYPLREEPPAKPSPPAAVPPTHLQRPSRPKPPSAPSAEGRPANAPKPNPAVPRTPSARATPAGAEAPRSPRHRGRAFPDSHPFGTGNAERRLADALSIRHDRHCRRRPRRLHAGPAVLAPVLAAVIAINEKCPTRIPAYRPLSSRAPFDRCWTRPEVAWRPVRV